jgi:hypothetical protein
LQNEEESHYIPPAAAGQPLCALPDHALLRIADSFIPITGEFYAGNQSGGHAGGFF